jgi:hypothetical protein
MMGDNKIVNRNFLRGLLVVFPLSIVSFFFLDGSLSFMFTEHWRVPPANVSAWLVLFSVLRAVYAEWVMSSVFGFSGSRSSLKRVTGFSIALAFYGVPLLAVSEPVRSPISPIVLSLLEWVAETFNVKYLPRFAAAAVSFLCLTLLLDFSRLAPYLCIKRWLHSRLNVEGEEGEIIPMSPKEFIPIYLLSIIALYLFDMFILVPFPTRDHPFFR